MPATYDPTLPTPRDRLRRLTADTSTSAPILQDEEIDAMLATFGLREGSAQVVDAVATWCSMQPDSYEESNGFRVSYRERARDLRSLAARIRGGEVLIDGGAASRPVGGVLASPDLVPLEDWTR